MITTLEVNRHDLIDVKSAHETVLEAVSRSLPKKIKEHLNSKQNREDMLKKYGKDAFLMPDKLKFPIIDPHTGEKDCRLIYAAYVRARQWMDQIPEYKDIASKAKNLYDKQNCSNKINISINESDITIDLSMFVTTFECCYDDGD